ncbi:PMEI domain-containing protein [Cephalotus follicularis]|uniref:PMEI domain-containing protein n=1 Tax=Cephalotus follicularis TaxID=3775 RepID=A0A1Q3BV59_CEPFO|nr:PMEI domain-containing protein [Cephalotus follicularis]
MRPIFFSFFFLLFFLTFHTITTQDLINATCKKCAQNDPNLSYNFCVNSLQAAPNSHRANLRKLGTISIKLIENNVTDTTSFINVLMRNKKLDPFERACLNDCLELYSDAITTVKKAIKGYQSKQYDDANIELSSVMDASTTCEDGFKEEYVVSPLAKRNSATFQLSAIALSITNMLR